MNGLIDDITADGWMALCICILRGVPHDEAFRMLDDPTRRNLRWTPEILAEVEEMREDGMTCDDIAAMYHVHKAGICRAYHRYKGRQTTTHQKHDEEFYLKIDEMRKNCIKWKDISKEFGISEGRLCGLYSWWKNKQEQQNDK